MSREIMAECLEEAVDLVKVPFPPGNVGPEVIATIAVALYQERCREKLPAVSIPSVWAPGRDTLPMPTTTTISPIGETTWYDGAVVGHIVKPNTSIGGPPGDEKALGAHGSDEPLS